MSDDRADAARAMASLSEDERAAGAPSMGQVIAAFALISHEAEDRQAGIPPVLATDATEGRSVLRRFRAFGWTRSDGPPDDDRDD